MNLFLITPSYLIKSRRVHREGIKQLQKLGFTVINPEFIDTLPSPREKAEQLHRAFADPAVEVILAQRGGYSAMKSLPFLDFELIRRHPKILAGFSDLTAMLNPIFDRTGLTTLHAPMLINLDTPTVFTLKSFRNALQGFPQNNLLKGAPVKVYQSGTASGILKGGNLITLTALIASPWETPLDGSILFLEDVDEKLHQVDRYLTQWVLTGRLQKIAALILGDFRGIKNTNVYEIIAGHLPAHVPVIHTPNIGHVKNKITLPVGARVELDTANRELLVKQLNMSGAVS